MKTSLNILNIIRLNTIKLNDFFAEVDNRFLSRLPFCRRNLLILSNFCTSKIFYETVSDYFLCGRDIMWPELKKKYMSVLEKHSYVNFKFLNLFLSFFTPIYKCMYMQIQRVLDSDSKDYHKIKNVRNIICDLYNLVAMQLFGLDICCSVLKEGSLCSNNQELCTKVCEKRGAHPCESNTNNTIILFVNPLFYHDKYPELLDDIVSSLSLIKDKQAILFVDYTYILPEVSDSVYKWESSDAFSRYEKVKNYVAEIYFVNFEKVDFGKYRDQLEPFMIYNKEDYRTVLKHWKEQKQAVKLR